MLIPAALFFFGVESGNSSYRSTRYLNYITLAHCYFDKYWVFAVYHSQSFTQWGKIIEIRAEESFIQTAVVQVGASE